MNTPTIAQNIDGTIGLMTVGMIEIIGTIAITDKTFIQSKHRPAYLKFTGDLQSDLEVAGFFHIRFG
jgi:hypothetical protein